MLSHNTKCTIQPQNHCSEGVQIGEIPYKATRKSLAMRYSLSVLLILLTQLNDLVDVVVGTQVQRTNVHLDIVLQKVFS